MLLRFAPLAAARHTLRLVEEGTPGPATGTRVEWHALSLNFHDGMPIPMCPRVS